MNSLQQMAAVHGPPPPNQWGPQGPPPPSASGPMMPPHPAPNMSDPMQPQMVSLKYARCTGQNFI